MTPTLELNTTASDIDSSLDNGYGFEIEGTDDIVDVVSEIDQAVSEMDSSPVVDETPTKRTFLTPFIPRKLFLKKLREEGKLKPRHAAEKRAQAQKDKDTLAEAKQLRQRSETELKAIRGYYGRRAA